MSCRRVTLTIQGMSCAGEAQAVERALARVTGVRLAYVNPLTEMAYVEYDPEILESGGLEHAVHTAGYHLGEPNPR